MTLVLFLGAVCFTEIFAQLQRKDPLSFSLESGGLNRKVGCSWAELVLNNKLKGLPFS
jgi:hypothetical protein